MPRITPAGLATAAGVRRTCALAATVFTLAAVTAAVLLARGRRAVPA